MGFYFFHYMGASRLSFCPGWWLKGHHRTLGKDIFWRDRFLDDIYKIGFCWFPLMIINIFGFWFLFWFYFVFDFPFPSVRWWNPSGQCVSKTWWTISDFLVLKIEKYFGLLTDVKKSLRNVKHRSEILSTRSTSLDNQKYIFLLIYSRKVKTWNKN